MIAIYNLEPKYFNLALEKVTKYYRQQKKEVVEYYPLWHNTYNKIYASSIFTFTDKSDVTPDMIYGGSGFDLTTQLPPEIENIKIYKNKGFTTRGCIRNCVFCIVPQKEGYVRAVGDLMDLWDRENKEIILYDNNILSLPHHFELICEQARDNKIRLDFNQGLDHRLLTQEIVDLLKSIRHSELRFAFDHPSLLPTVEKAINLLQQNNINRCLWYVLVGFNTTFEQDLERLNYLKSQNQNAYVQRHIDSQDKSRHIALAMWANQHQVFQAMSFRDFCYRPERKKYRAFVHD